VPGNSELCRHVISISKPLCAFNQHCARRGKRFLQFQIANSWQVTAFIHIQIVFDVAKIYVISRFGAFLLPNSAENSFPIWQCFRRLRRKS
jgi:hypothetical protein